MATPLGNPGDLSPRAREALSEADAVLAEDTRRTGALLAACGLKAARLVPLHEHNEEQSLPGLLAELQQGRNLALVSDAGTPLLSDPGYKLVRACRAAGRKVRPLPGPCAALAALTASGLPPSPFIFLGFPPRRDGERQRFFAPFASLPLTLVFFERKDRLRGVLELLFSLSGPREICLARELTKTYEEFIFFTLGDFDALPARPLGEFTLVAGPPSPRAGLGPEQALGTLLRLRRAGGDKLPPRALARLARELLPGWSVDDIYALLQKEGGKS